MFIPYEYILEPEKSLPVGTNLDALTGLVFVGPAGLGDHMNVDDLIECVTNPIHYSGSNVVKGYNAPRYVSQVEKDILFDFCQEKGFNLILSTHHPNSFYLASKLTARVSYGEIHPPRVYSIPYLHCYILHNLLSPYQDFNKEVRTRADNVTYHKAVSNLDYAIQTWLQGKVALGAIMPDSVRWNVAQGYLVVDIQHGYTRTNFRYVISANPGSNNPNIIFSNKGIEHTLPSSAFSNIVKVTD